MNLKGGPIQSSKIPELEYVADVGRVMYVTHYIFKS